MELSTLIVLWVVVTTAVVILAYMRMTMGLHDILDIHLSGDRPAVNPDDARRGTRMERIDKIGIPLTVVSGLMAIAITLMWAAEQAAGR